MSVFYVCDSVSLLDSFVLIFRFHIQAISYSICVCLLTSLSMICRSIHVAADLLIPVLQTRKLKLRDAEHLAIVPRLDTKLGFQPSFFQP